MLATELPQILDGSEQPLNQKTSWHYHGNHEQGGLQQLCHTHAGLDLEIRPKHFPDPATKSPKERDKGRTIFKSAE